MNHLSGHLALLKPYHLLRELDSIPIKKLFFRPISGIDRLHYVHYTVIYLVTSMDTALWGWGQFTASPTMPITSYSQCRIGALLVMSACSNVVFWCHPWNTEDATCVPFYQHGLTAITSWINSHTVRYVLTWLLSAQIFTIKKHKHLRKSGIWRTILSWDLALWYLGRYRAVYNILHWTALKGFQSFNVRSNASPVHI